MKRAFMIELDDKDIILINRTLKDNGVCIDIMTTCQKIQDFIHYYCNLKYLQLRGAGENGFVQKSGL